VPGQRWAGGVLIGCSVLAVGVFGDVAPAVAVVLAVPSATLEGWLCQRLGERGDRIARRARRIRELERDMEA
jgi:hypothetical protein